MRPYFSVVIPVYNCRQLLLLCLDSIKAAIAKMPDEVAVEVICVDDGSTDGSGALLDDYAASNRWCRIIHQENHGTSIARNTGLDAATGEWLSFVDMDDYVSEDYFSSFLGKEVKADINFFAHTRVFESGQCVTNRLDAAEQILDYEAIPHLVFNLIYNKTEENLFGYTWNKFIRMSLVKNNRIRFPEIEHYIEYEDEIFTFEVCHYAASASYSPEVKYYYRIGNNNQSSKRIPSHLNRARCETAIGDMDDRFEFKAATYMSAGMALLMRAYVSPSPRVAFETARYLKCHQKYMVTVVVRANHLAKLTRLPGVVLWGWLWFHGCASILKRICRR